MRERDDMDFRRWSVGELVAFRDAAVQQGTPWCRTKAAEVDTELERRRTGGA